jgi:hypothetical protein
MPIHKPGLKMKLSLTYTMLMVSKRLELPGKKSVLSELFHGIYSLLISSFPPRTLRQLAVEGFN